MKKEVGHVMSESKFGFGIGGLVPFLGEFIKVGW